MSDVNVATLVYNGDSCTWDSIEPLLEELELFWTENGPEEEIELTVRFHTMSRDEFDELPEFNGW